MQIKREELLKALEVVKPGLASKEFIEQSTHFAFRENRVVTFNDKISISYPVPNLDIEGAVYADKLFTFLSKVKKDEVEIEKNGNELQLSAGRTKAGLTFQDEVKLPLDDIDEHGKWKDIPDWLLKGLNFCRFSCSNDIGNEGLLTCVHVSKDGYVEASDKRRFTLFKTTPLPKGVSSFLIPGEVIGDLTKYSFDKFSVQSSWVHFKGESGIIFSCRRYEEEGVFSKEKEKERLKQFNVKGKQVKLPNSLSEMLDRVGVFSYDQQNLGQQVEVEIKGTKIKLKASELVGWAEDTANINYKGDPIRFLIDPNILNEVISKVSHCTLGQNVIKFEGEVHENGKETTWEHVIGLLSDPKE